MEFWSVFHCDGCYVVNSTCHAKGHWLEETHRHVEDDCAPLVLSLGWDHAHMQCTHHSQTQMGRVGGASLVLCIWTFVQSWIHEIKLQVTTNIMVFNITVMVLMWQRWK